MKYEDMDMEYEDKDLPEWARGRLKAEEAMGEMEANASVGLTVGVIAMFAFEFGLFLAACMVIYMIGEALLG